MSDTVFRKSSFIYIFFLSLLLSASCAGVKSIHPKPTLFLIGDSTVKNGKGNGDGGLWGWGSYLSEFFDTTQVSVQNYALGGTSSRTFRTQGHWDKVLPKIKPGDYVMMQFGHNDSSPVNDTLRARGTIKNNSEEIQEIDNLITKKHEVVHSYGWYLRQYIKDVKAIGATPIVLSPVPRNSWNGGRPNRNDQDYGKWAAEAAAQEEALFIHLNKIIADRYEQEGEEKVRSTYFNTTDHTHTIEAGAKVNAASVVEGIKQNKKLELNKYLSSQGKSVRSSY
ncbi:rhamnogalacturonan acetylesterase [Pontibacter toksunensis]|uniref:Rhamnogalacturonan acetylesterase n=1 Tax=Pontibacter toksunensis TaxID=1332631 RepID=A0ABW6C431_9BACT